MVNMIDSVTDELSYFKERVRDQVCSDHNYSYAQNKKDTHACISKSYDE